MVAGNLAERPRQWADSAGTGWIVGPPTAPAKKEKNQGSHTVQGPYRSGRWGALAMSGKDGY